MDRLDRDFLAEFRAAIDRAEAERPVVIQAPPLPRPAVTVPNVRRFNIHKRSLPPGIDKPVVLSITRAEADRWVGQRLKARSYTDDARDSKTLVYYDIVPEDAAPRERSIYHNPRPFVLEG